MHCVCGQEGYYYHGFESNLRRFVTSSTLGFSVAARFPFAGGNSVAVPFGFFLTTTPFKDFLMIFFAGTWFLSTGTLAVVGLSAVVAEDSVGREGLFVAFSRAATALDNKNTMKILRCK